MRKVAKKMREEAEQLQSQSVIVRKEDKAIEPFSIPFSILDSSFGGGATLLEISSVALPSM